jgi:hypothetical protein
MKGEEIGSIEVLLLIFEFIRRKGVLLFMLVARELYLIKGGWAELWLIIFYFKGDI